MSVWIMRSNDTDYKVIIGGDNEDWIMPANSNVVGYDFLKTTRDILMDHFKETDEDATGKCNQACLDAIFALTVLQNYFK